tara:strand:- start:5279 stop:5896 length:618 start_codon:yes stop_codon:yes gene_type:complete
MPEPKSVWERLSSIDVSHRVEHKTYMDKKNGRKVSLAYLSWAWAWGEVKKLYPHAVYDVLDDIIYPDGSIEVRVNVTIEGQTHSMWLPVMDYKMQSIKNPPSRSVSDARMRCLVKAIAMHGLGHYIFAGEDTPDPEGQEEQRAMHLDTQARAETAIEFYENCDDYAQFEAGESRYKKLIEREDIELDLRDQLVEIHALKKMELTR